MEFFDLTIEIEKPENGKENAICLSQTLYNYAQEDITSGEVYLPPEQAIIVARKIIKMAQTLIEAKDSSVNA